MTSVRNDPAYPCTSPPPIKPWSGFDIHRETDCAIATRIVAELLADDQWHTPGELASELNYELDFDADRTRKLLTAIQSHGDIRRDNVGNYRITTRWRSHPHNTEHVQAALHEHDVTETVSDTEELGALPNMSVVQFRGPGLRGKTRLVYQFDELNWYAPGDTEALPSDYFPPEAYPAHVLWKPTA